MNHGKGQITKKAKNRRKKNAQKAFALMEIPLSILKAVPRIAKAGINANKAGTKLKNEMSNKVKGFTITIDNDIRRDDIDDVINAIKAHMISAIQMLKGPSENGRIDKFSIIVEDKPPRQDYEYEMLIDYDDGPFEKGSWIPCATDCIKRPERIHKYIKSGLLRKIKID